VPTLRGGDAGQRAELPVELDGELRVRGDVRGHPVLRHRLRRPAARGVRKKGEGEEEVSDCPTTVVKVLCVLFWVEL
jgi:hypothetical protein